MILNPLEHGVLLNGKHSIKDYGMVLKDRPSIGPPEPKTSTIDIPGSDGVLDFTEALTGEVKLSQRPIVLTFKARIPDSQQAEFESRLMDDLHGKRIEIVLDEDPEWAWNGRVSVAFSEKSDWKETITISGNVDPYKLAIDISDFEVVPDSFKTESVVIGQGTAAQGTNSIFYFGTSTRPTENLTPYSKLRLSWAHDAPHIGAATIQFLDGDGKTFNDDVKFFDREYWEIAVNDDAIIASGINMARISKILLSGIGRATLTGFLPATASVRIYNDRMSVVPIWTVTSAQNFAAFINGRYVEFNGSGVYRHPEVKLTQGENEIVFLAENPRDLSIRCEFRRGRL